MSTPLVPSITDEQIAEIQKEFARQAPCAHWNRVPIGFGHYYHCDDCGRDVSADCLESAKAASDRHDELEIILSAALSRLRAAERKIQLWEPIMDEVDRRAGKECYLEDRCDFTVTVSYEDYAAMQEHNQ